MASIEANGLRRSCPGSKPSYTVCSGLYNRRKVSKGPVEGKGSPRCTVCEESMSWFLHLAQPALRLPLLHVRSEKSQLSYPSSYRALSRKTRYLLDDEVLDRTWRDRWPQDTHLSLLRCIRTALTCSIGTLWFLVRDICASRLPAAVSPGARSDSSSHTSADA